MGTNYYLKREEKATLHIGKSSGGWTFALHIIPEEGINSLYDWLKLFHTPGNYIQNEYDESISPGEMIKIITRRSWGRDLNDLSWREFHEANHSEAGPNGLARRRADDRCVSHGEGTWDNIIGEFS